MFLDGVYNARGPSTGAPGEGGTWRDLMGASLQAEQKAHDLHPWFVTRPFAWFFFPSCTHLSALHMHLDPVELYWSQNST